MKRLNIILFALLLLTSCEERTPDFFQDICGVYFSSKSAGMSVTDSLDLTFVYEASDVLEVPVRIQLLGRAAGHDRNVELTVTSENAEEGIDYVLPEHCVLPAGGYAFDYMVRLNRTEALKSARKMITLRLHPNDEFTLPVTSLVQTADTVSTVELRIYFSDMFTTAPDAWEEGLIGDFSQQKFVLICDVLDIAPADFNDPGVITLAKQLYIAAEMSAYVREQVERRAAGEEYDLNAFDPETGEPLIFR